MPALPIWAYGLLVAVLGGAFWYGRRSGSGSYQAPGTELNQPATLSTYPGVGSSGESSLVGYGGSPIVNPGVDTSYSGGYFTPSGSTIPLGGARYETPTGGIGSGGGTPRQSGGRSGGWSSGSPYIAAVGGGSGFVSQGQTSPYIQSQQGAFHL